MAFKALAPVIMQLVPNIKASLRRRAKSEEIYAYISLSGHFLSSFKCTTSRLHVLGDEDEHLVQVKFAESGPFKLVPFAKGGGSFTMPMFGDETDQEVAAIPCKLQSQDLASFIFHLPYQWFTTPTKSAVERIAVIPQKVATKPDVSGKMNKVDPIKYLGNRGIKVAKLAGNFWQMGPERVTTAEILVAINAQREKAGLGPIDAGDLLI